MVRVVEHECSHSRSDSSHSGNVSGDSPTGSLNGLNLVGLNLLDSLNEADDPKNAIKNIQIPSPASTYASRASSQRSSRTSEDETKDCLIDNPLNSIAHDLVEWVESPIRPCSRMSVFQANQNKERLDSPLRPEGKLAQPQTDQKRQVSTSNESFDHMPGHQPQQQPFAHLKVITPATTLCAASPVQPLAVCQLNPDVGIGMVEHEHVQQRNVTWFGVACDEGLLMRYAPYFEAQWTGEILHKNEIFSVDQEIMGEGGRVYLRLTDGRGWAFDDSALAPQSPSVVHMVFVPVSQPPVPCNTNDLMTPNRHQPEPSTSFCGGCSYQMKASAKFCCICGKKQQLPAPR
eukprot:gnl/MRDRNA2_/MRDRNA2_74480_c0_seq2.p1 gnl/MRDRNA2_/MRDRNA2_74480_c0~~gnl/MRDRNA2_/MRDRNA2_74480_c0_seq2.p1  ORF type:complete len:402 (-),score=54.38 gnl/MRDRNA2_/MRDRNA2_74480_c0_seq2:260-1297(-)